MCQRSSPADDSFGLQTLIARHFSFGDQRIVAVATRAWLAAASTAVVRRD
jgi:hypothetical protein